MKVRIGLGLLGFPFSSAAAYWRWVELCEVGGVDSIWQSDRLVSTEPQLEPMSTLAALAGATERLKFGMSVVVMPFRDPLVLAKECATIDYLSGGRLLPAFGVGGERIPEWRATGRSPRGRGAAADEALEIMSRLWSEERVTFEGEHFRYRDASIAPRPVQQPLPLWIGGSSPAAIRRTARFGTGWLAGPQTPAQAAPLVAAIREQSRAAGRPVPEDHYGAGFMYRFGEWSDPEVERAAAPFRGLPGFPDPQERFVVGGADEMVARVREYEAAGVTKFVLRPIAEGDEAILEQTRLLVEEVLPRVHVSA